METEHYLHMNDANANTNNTSNAKSSVFSREDQSDFVIWNICDEISEKTDWYSKVFNKKITEKWRAEVQKQTPTKNIDDEFDYAIRLMQATAQGTVHEKDCEWEDGEKLCTECREKVVEYIRNNKEEFDLIEKYAEPDDSNEDEAINRVIAYEDQFDNYCSHSLCKCTPANSELHQYVQYKPVGVLDDNQVLECRRIVHDMMNKEKPDWHPGSNGQVRDLIHPSLYCYVRGISKGKSGEVFDTTPCDESKKYQWLPSVFRVRKDAPSNTVTCQVKTYINNLDHKKYPKFVPMIEKVFAAFVPDIEQVLKKQIVNKDIQVIVKVGNIVLSPGENTVYKGGSWHLEGLPQEHIACTAIYYLDMDNLTDSFLEFKKPVIISETPDYQQNDRKYTTHHYGIEKDSHHEGVQSRYLGLIKCTKESSVVFPNTLLHRVKDFKLNDQTRPGLRTILAFFVVDPSYPIVSTEDIPNQAANLSMTRESAEEYRLRLMFHRKYFVNQVNKEIFQRSYSLCEH